MTLRPVMDGTVSELRWTAVAVVVVMVLSAVDLSLPSANISGALVVAPFLVSGGARPGWVLVVGALATTGAIGLAFFDDSSLTASAARMTVIVVGTVVAAQASTLRARRQQRLLDLATVAEAAQRAIIRQPDPQVGSVAVATWYQSSVRAATVGGDCYDVVLTPFGTRAIVGDVRGHGMPSVRLAALVLGAFRALVYIEADLAVVVRELDLLVARYSADRSDSEVDGEEFVTAVICQFKGSALTIANCGHPPPLMISPSGQVRHLDTSTPTAPLGLGSNPALDTVDIVPCGRLLLYTDGLIEAVDPSGRCFDIDAAASDLVAGPVGTGIATLTGRFYDHAEGHVNDDVALMLLEPLTGAEPSNTVQRVSNGGGPEKR